MEHTGRYNASGFIEGQFEPGSRGRVLRNRIGIKRKREMDALESTELLRTTERLIHLYDRDHRFTTEELRSIHREWLGKIYEWAGNFRSVNLAKGGFPFAAAHLIPKLMNRFEQQYLAVYTPCRMAGEKAIVQAIAVVHAEFLLIHPFREGNGRLGRLLASLMALQAGYPLLDFGMLKGGWKQDYFKAIRYGLDRRYEPLERIFDEVLEHSLRLMRRKPASSDF